MSVVNIGYDYSTCVVVEKREFEDICISALRYCLYRHSYILDSTLGFIERHSSEVMSKRVFNVMLHDVNTRLENWSNNSDELWMNDYERIKIFKDWLVDYGENYGYCSEECK